jgi:hypothetical protein
MAAAVILEFSGVGPDQYWAANRQLGIDIVSGTEGFPDGLIAHYAGEVEAGTFVVSEVWSSPEAQAEFMASRLGKALAEAGIPAPSKVTWVPLLAHRELGG